MNRISSINSILSNVSNRKRSADRGTSDPRQPRWIRPVTRRPWAVRSTRRAIGSKVPGREVRRSGSTRHSSHTRVPGGTRKASRRSGGLGFHALVGKQPVAPERQPVAYDKPRNPPGVASLAEGRGASVARTRACLCTRQTPSLGSPRGEQFRHGFGGDGRKAIARRTAGGIGASAPLTACQRMSLSSKSSIRSYSLKSIRLDRSAP
jgi:hypothetical protein